jgi:hypothetical protein
MHDVLVNEKQFKFKNFLLALFSFESSLSSETFHLHYLAFKTV